MYILKNGLDIETKQLIVIVQSRNCSSPSFFFLPFFLNTPPAPRRSVKTNIPTIPTPKKVCLFPVLYIASGEDVAAD
mgnify:CR=1 FL=1